MLSEAQIEPWRLALEEYNSDTQQVKGGQEANAKRTTVREEIVALLHKYFDRSITREEFRDTLQRRASKEWKVFGLGGFAGAMFFNMLAKNISDSTSSNQQLLSIMPAPKDAIAGRERMSNFIQFLEGIILSKQARRQQIQPSSVPFFVSAMWHMQDTEQWPVFYTSVRQIFEHEGFYTPKQNLVEEYFIFRDCFMSLANVLKLKSWDLMNLLEWYQLKNSRTATQISTTTSKKPNEKESSTLTTEAFGDVDVEEEDTSAKYKHEEIQLILAKIGKKLGCQVWIAENDHNKKWKGERLGDFSISKLPSLALDEESERFIRLIDVVWIKGTKQVVAAFEVEHTTSIYSGILRMSDLAVEAPNTTFPMYIVVPEAKLRKVRRQLSRPTFQHLELHKRCGYLSDEKLMSKAEQIMELADDSSVIKRIADYVGDVSGNEWLIKP